MKNNTPELLPCPFCGSEAELDKTEIPQISLKIYTVGCLNPDCGGSMRNPEEKWLYPEDCVKAWNTRAKDSDKGGNT